MPPRKLSFWDDPSCGVTLGGLCALLAMPTALLYIPHDCPSDLFFRPIFTVLFLGMLSFTIGWMVVLRVRRMMHQSKSKRHTPIPLFAARKRHPFRGRVNAPVIQNAVRQPHR